MHRTHPYKQELPPDALPADRLRHSQHLLRFVRRHADARAAQDLRDAGTVWVYRSGAELFLQPRTVRGEVAR